MATAPKPGGYNDLNALRMARQTTAEAAALVERALDEVTRMREHVGRPDYGRLERRLGELALRLAKTSAALDEMWAIRPRPEGSREIELTRLEARVAALEAALARQGEAVG